ncbi:blr2374 [Bradyrhizobium diazoefficiens USDA 110]|uniref:Blr2374 protein n=2 Tax=Nitrobacteraceae TaxID=41294 RepID=Q89SM6_BRADU|nr:glycosyl transferase [Bradyrhizobium diazoefficiens USDA 110]AWO89405.1 glycosyltransferase family 4 protein [Bradyrhizobium diazoefficiens]PDT57942.1 glycosyltransferase family 1 protein [Bradyrhizobium diazoefficiens]QBP21201.1 glycosyltransferase family 1 protein [Bradyrhizobium diazoefficiens]QLD45833.1 glycosyltransferase family 4 protein [Bradyrhizobium diazoefficiens]
MQDPMSGAPNVMFLVEVVNCNDGIASYCETLATGLHARGVQIHLVSGIVRSDEKSEYKRQKLAAAVKQWHVVPGLRKLPSLSIFMQLWKLIRENDITVINVHGLGMLMWGRLLSLLTGARCVATYHPSALGNIEKVQNAPQSTFSPVQILFFNLFFPHTLILMSEESLRHLRRYVLFGKNRIAKVYGGVDTVHFRPPSDAERRDARAKFGVAEGEFMCLLAARLAWVKGHDLLIKAARRIRDSASPSPIDIKCYFVGSGGAEREKEIKSFAFADEKDKDTFKFLGFMGDVREILWAADVFALPSRFEGFPLGVAEAMATGLVPVRTPAGGASDQIIDGQTGFIVPFEDVDALVGALEKLADPALRAALSRNALARAQQYFGVGPMVDQTLRIYGLAGDASGNPLAHPMQA